MASDEDDDPVTLDELLADLPYIEARPPDRPQ